MSVSVDPDWWKTLFDEVYLITDARTVCNDEMTRREIDVFCNLIPMKVNDRILDLCGGHGRHTLELCHRGFLNCTVFDHSHALLKIGADNAEKKEYAIEFIQGDARKIKLDDDTYDHVMILGNSLGYIPDDKSDLLILKESRRVMKSKGWLLLDVTDGKTVRRQFIPNAWHEINEDVVVCRQRELNENFLCAREMVLSKQNGVVRDKAYCIRLYEPEHLSELLTDAGFIDIQFYSNNHSFANNHGPDRKEDLGCMNHRLIVSARKP